MGVSFATVDRELGPADTAARMCFSRLRFVSTLLKERLQREGLWDDLVQEVYATAWEAWQKQLNEKDTYRIMSRRLHAFLKSCGLRVYRHGYYRMEIPLSAISQDEKLQERTLAMSMGKPSVPFMGGSDHIGEKILALIEKSPIGLSKRDLCTHLCISRQELDWHCAPLIKQRLVLEVKRENTFGRTPTPILVAAGQAPPVLTMVKTEQVERIRHAYFVEKKSIKQIARELRHSKTTVRSAIYSAAVELAWLDSS